MALGMLACNSCCSNLLVPLLPNAHRPYEAARHFLNIRSIQQRIQDMLPAADVRVVYMEVCYRAACNAVCKTAHIVVIVCPRASQLLCTAATPAAVQGTGRYRTTYGSSAAAGGLNCRPTSWHTAGPCKRPGT